MFKCVCGYQLTKTQYHAPNGNVYDNYVCPACHRYFKSAKIKHLRLFSSFSVKIKNSVALFNGNMVYFPREGILIKKLDEKYFIFTFVSKTVIVTSNNRIKVRTDMDEFFLYPFKTSPPFPLSQLK